MGMGMTVSENASACMFAATPIGGDLDLGACLASPLLCLGDRQDPLDHENLPNPEVIDGSACCYNNIT